MAVIICLAKKQLSLIEEDIKKIFKFQIEELEINYDMLIVRKRNSGKHVEIYFGCFNNG